MTLLIATLRSDFAVVSQDTFCADQLNALDTASGAISTDIAEAAATTFQGPGVKPAVAPVAFASKIVLLPHMPMIVAGSGCFASLLGWVQMLMAHNLANDLDSLRLIAPMMLREIRRAVGSRLGLICTHVGFDAQKGHVGGFACASEHDFEAVPLSTEGHTLTPMPTMADPEYDELERLWTACDTPAACENFHLLAAKNQYRAWERGLYPKWAGIGGQLHTARLDPTGLSVRVSHEFPNYREHLERVRLDNRFRVYSALRAAAGAAH